VFAFIAAVVAWMNLKHQQKESARALGRRIRANRALLPHSLSIFMRYLQECYTIAARIRSEEGAPTTNQLTWKKMPWKKKIPPLSEQVLDDLRTLIAHLDEDYDKDAGILIKVLQVYQVQRDRFESVLADMDDDTLVGQDTEEYFKRMGRDVVFLHVLIESLFSFAREEQPHITLDLSEGAAARAFRILESHLPSDLLVGFSEGEMCTYMVDYVGKAVQRHFPDPTG